MAYADYDETGVYAITNTVTGECYIGVSRILHARFLEHKCDLSKHKHYNTRLQAAWDTYGADCFTFTVLQRFESEDPETYFVSSVTTAAAEAEWCYALQAAYNMKLPRRYPRASRSAVMAHLIAEFLNQHQHDYSFVPVATGRRNASTWYQPGI